MRATLLLVAFVVTGCAGQAGVDTPAGSWTLTSATDATGPLTLDESHPVTLDFGENTGGVAACNSYGAIYSEGRFIQIGHTEMGCEPASVMELESRYLRALSVVTSAKSGAGLTLTGPEVELTFVPTPEASALPLTDTAWTLVTFTTTDAPDASVSGSPDAATLTFSTDGDLALDTGCTTITTGYELDGQTITPGSTQKTIDDPSCEHTDLGTQLHAIISRPFTVEQPTTLNRAQLVLTSTTGEVASFTAG